MRVYSRRELARILVGAGVGVALWPGAGCSPFDGSAALAGGKVVLPFSQFGKLAAAGGSAVVDVPGSFPLVVVRTTIADAVALSATCTHAGCILDYQPRSNDIHCDCHDADFSLSGQVLRGPPPVPLPTYPATVGADAITVIIAS